MNNCAHSEHRLTHTTSSLVCMSCGVITSNVCIQDNGLPDYQMGMSKAAVSRDILRMKATLTRVGVSTADISDIRDTFIKKITLLSSYGIVVKGRTRNAVIVVSVFDTLSISDTLKYHFLKVFRVSGKHINSVYKIIKKCQL